MLKKNQWPEKGTKMKNTLKKIAILLRNMAISAVCYSIILILFSYFLLNYKTFSDIYNYLNSVAYYTGLGFTLTTVIYWYLSKQIRYKIGQVTTYIVIFILIGIGIYLIITSNSSIWDNPPFNVSVLGAGISTAALGLAFLFALSSHEQSQDNKNLEKIESRLDEKFEELSDYSGKAEQIIAKCQNLIEEYRKLKESKD